MNSLNENTPTCALIDSMKHPLMKRILNFAVIICLLLLVSSCGSKRAAVVEAPKIEHPSNLPTEVPEKEKKPQNPKPEKKKDNRSASVGNIMKEARKWMGTPYRYGGKSRAGTDCSGFVMSVFQEAAGIKLPRSSREQQVYCEGIDRRRLEPGDLVFFSTSRRSKAVSHVGIYIGDGDFIHASTSKGVIISSMDERYYTSHYHSCGRVEALGKGNYVEIEQELEQAEAKAELPEGREPRYEPVDRLPGSRRVTARPPQNKSAEPEPAPVAVEPIVIDPVATEPRVKPVEADTVAESDSIREAVRRAIQF